MSKLEKIRTTLRAALDARAPVWVAPPILQPAAVYLELSGEDIRRRAFLIDDHSHGELCLRPDMTVPAVRAAFEADKLAPIVAYEGLVFRRQEPGSARESEFTQIGAEWLGEGANVAAEAEIIAFALESCRAAGVEPKLKLGDVALVAGFVASLGLADPWPRRVLRAMARPGGLKALRSQKQPALTDEGMGLAEAFAALPADHAEAALVDLLGFARIAQVGGRPIGEIAERLRQRGKLVAAAPPSSAQYDVLEALTRIDGPGGLEDADKLAEALTERAPARAALDAAKARLEALSKLTKLPAETAFAPGLGKTLAYYDGFVFELEADKLGDRASLGGGGRYDGLARALWPSSRAAPSGLRAAGFALRPQRLAEAAS